MAKKGINIYKRKDGRWEGRYIKEYINNKPKYGYVYSRNYSETKEKLLNKNIHNIENIEVAADLTLYNISAEWLNSVKIKVKQSTYTKYHIIINKYIKDSIGNIQMNTLTSATIADYTNKLINDLSNRTVRNILCIISMILKYYRNAYNTPLYIVINYPKCNKPDKEILTDNEIKLLEKYLINDITIKKIGILLTLYTGLRLGEICSLKWEDIDLENGYISIKRTLQRVKNIDIEKEPKTILIEGTPKSQTSARKIPLPIFLIDILTIYRCENKTHYLLTDSLDYIEPRTYQNYFKKCLKDTKVTDVTFHTLRHTFATRCIVNGFDIKSLSEILGHSSVKITLDLYVHSSLEQKKNNMDKLELLTKNKPSAVRNAK